MASPITYTIITQINTSREGQRVLMLSVLFVFYETQKVRHTSKEICRTFHKLFWGNIAFGLSFNFGGGFVFAVDGESCVEVERSALAGVRRSVIAHRTNDSHRAACLINERAANIVRSHVNSRNVSTAFIVDEVFGAVNEGVIDGLTVTFLHHDILAVGTENGVKQLGEAIAFGDPVGAESL